MAAEELKPVMESPVAAIEAPITDGPSVALAANSELNDMIMLRVDSDIDESRNSDLATKDVDNNLKVSDLDMDKDEPMSLSDLSLSFQQCLNANRNTKQVNKAQGSVGLQLKPFDYETARTHIVFGDRSVDGAGRDKDERKLRGSKVKKNPDGAEERKYDETAEFSQGRRRKAFPATGNRSATFR